MRGKKKAITILFCLFCVISVSSIINASLYIRDYKGYIEVFIKGIAHVPKDVRYVNCNGVVRKVLDFVKVLPDAMEDCRSQECCEGECYVIMIKDPKADQKFDSLKNSPTIQTEKYCKTEIWNAYIACG